MLWLGALPAVLVFFIIRGVSESPVWLERQRHLKKTEQQDRLSLVVLFDRSIVRTTLHTATLMGAFLFMYHSATFWYPTLLVQSHRETLPYLVAFNVAAIAGAVYVGRWSEGRLGRRGAATLATFIGIVSLPLYVWGSTESLLIVGALLMGFFGVGNFGVVPAYLNERFPTVVRAVGAGFAYHVGAGFGSLTPFIVGYLQDHGYSLPFAMTVCIATSATAVMLLIWLGPETRGSEFRPEH